MTRSIASAVLVSLALLSSACASSGSWRASASTAALVGGGVLAVAGPSVAFAGIALDPEPATPPVESFVLGGALAAVGVAAVIAGGVMAEEAPAS